MSVILLRVAYAPPLYLAGTTVIPNEPVFAQWDIVKNVIAEKSDSLGDKYSAYIRTGWGDYFYVSGPIHDKNNNLVGVILVGKTLTTLVR